MFSNVLCVKYIDPLLKNAHFGCLRNVLEVHYITRLLGLYIKIRNVALIKIALSNYKYLIIHISIGT